MRKIPDELWDEIKIILPPEKPDKTIGRPIVPFRKVLDGILYVLRTDVSGKCFQRSMVLALRVIDDFKSGHYLKYLKNYGLDYYKFIMISEVFDGDGYRLIVFLSKLL
jgi:hypothetical protein